MLRDVPLKLKCIICDVHREVSRRLHHKKNTVVEYGLNSLITMLYRIVIDVLSKFARAGLLQTTVGFLHMVVFA